MIVQLYVASSEFSVTLEFIPGAENDIADAMSRLRRNYMVDTESEHIYSEEHILSAISKSTELNESKFSKIGKLHNSKVGHFGLECTLKRFKDLNDVWQFQRPVPLLSTCKYVGYHHTRSWFHDIDIHIYGMFDYSGGGSGSNDRKRHLQ